jgi:site-specific recombinase XerD
MRAWDRLLDEYLEQLQSRGLSEGRQLQVRRELDRLGCWLKARRPRVQMEAVTSDLLITYIRRRSAYKAKATVSGVISILRGWGEYLVHRGVWSSNPLRWIQGPKLNAFNRVPRRISRGVLQSLFSRAAEHRLSYHRHVWITVLSVLYGTGIRRGELERLNLCDYSHEEGLLKIDGRKTGRQRQVVLPEVARRCFEVYLPRRQNHLLELGLSGEPALFISQSGGRLSGNAISRGIKGLADRARVKQLTLHQFRHSCASDLMESGVNLPQVQRVLGHQSITTTVRYLHVADPQRHEAVKLHPINQMLNGTGGGR